MFKKKKKNCKKETIKYNLYLQRINYGKNGPYDYCDESEGQTYENKLFCCAFFLGQKAEEQQRNMIFFYLPG